MPKVMDVRGNFVPAVVTGSLAKEISSEIARPAGNRQIAALKRAMNNRVSNAKRNK